MELNLYTQVPGAAVSDNYLNLISSLVRQHKIDVLGVVTAYATVSGVRALRDSFTDGSPVRSRWLIGLDDAITQPGALDLLLSCEDADVRVASFERIGLRFHPKVLTFGRIGVCEVDASIVGSANITTNALTGNLEAATVLYASGADDQRQLFEFWEALWAQGSTPTAKELREYRLRYETYSKLRSKLEQKVKSKAKSAPKKQEILTRDVAELDPSIATTCWIECGNVTAMGRELEFKAEQGLFFGVHPSKVSEKQLTFQVSSGEKIELKIKYQQNHMWRLQLNNAVPEVKKGLRPVLRDGSLGRSPFVAVFVRDKRNAFILKFIRLNSREFSLLRKKSKKYGTLGTTTTRTYGWC